MDEENRERIVRGRGEGPVEGKEKWERRRSGSGV